eukprot:TRINITY_DN959_c0_g1_i1.p1 TRINITY_DN959_c0_g1~~TRINITY_DN959_c0_g1_i1.p1  ORF type:complete len:474 (-),score=90.37 TRINITY_DN959_c0_g1_i1:31-1452(-)
MGVEKRNTSKSAVRSSVSNEVGPKNSSGQEGISWTELATHNVREDCWFAVRGKVYNVTSWIAKHPGGEDTIVLNGGKDATVLFEIYHPTKIYSMLAPYYVGEISHDEDHPAFPPMSPFYLSMKKKVEDYFVGKKMSPRHAPEMLLRTVLLIAVAFGLHYLSIFASNVVASFLYAFVMGIVCALICFMPVHEGSHASTTESPLMWRILGAVHDFVNGASFYTWLHQHFLGHHPYTNVSSDSELVDTLDPDVLTHDPDLRRIKPHQKYFDHYKWQQIYMPILYGLLGFKYRINDISIVFFTKVNGAINVNPLNKWHMTMFVAGKLFFVFYRIVLPCFFIPVWQSIMLFVVSDLITSYVLAFVFQVNHVIPQAKWPRVDKAGMVNMDWAEMQLCTTLDYAHGDWMTTFLTGALNYQVTHHLFPYISQVHYMEIAPIIRQHCKEAGITYNLLPNFTEALKAHIKYLGIMGVNAHTDF